MIHLTPKHKKVAEALLCGISNAEIGEIVGWEESSVKNAVHAIMDLSGMDDRVSLALWLHEHREKLGITCPCDWGLEPIEFEPPLAKLYA